MPFVLTKNKSFVTLIRKFFILFFVTLLSFPASLFFTNILDLNQKVEALDATGGIITYSGNYKIHTFTSSGTFTPNGSGTVEVLVVGGGGGGGAGGGAAGGVVYSSAYSVTSSAISVSIGEGGAHNVTRMSQTSTGSGSNGSNSVFGTITAYGGGGGGAWAINGSSGGSGGGGGHNYGNSYTYGGSATKGTGGTLYGNIGGGSGGIAAGYPAGGGGGAGGAGGNAYANGGGAGGTGFSSSITGTAKYYAGGGGGSVATGTGTGGTGGSGVGGVGAVGSTSAAGDGVANTGGGGGGSSDSYYGGNGGSGIVIVRYTIPAASWYSASWQSRNPITISSDLAGGSNLTNFPLYIDYTDVNLKTARADGFDILFTSSDGTTKLSHEIDSFNQSTGNIKAWVKIPTISASASTVIYIYYGNAASSSTQANPTAVWASDTKAVYHWAGSSINDSTSGGFNFTTNTGTTSGVGKLNGSRYFSNSNYLQTETSPNLANSNFTISAWVKRGTIGTEQYFITQGIPANNTGMHLGFRGANTVTCAFWGNDLDSTNTITDTTNWHHYTCSFNCSTKARVIYIDGTVWASDTATACYSGSGTMRYGASTYSTIYSPFTGYLDDVMMYNSVKPQNWIQAQYNNQNNPSSYYTVGTKEANADNIAPTAPSKMTISGSWVGDHYVNGSFIVSAPSGSTDSGGSLLASYSLSRCDNSGLTTNCVVVASGILGTTVTVSGSNLPAEGSIKYYYWNAVDHAGNTSAKSTAEYIRMDSTAPSTPSMVALPANNSGTSIIVSSTVSTDSGIGIVQYNFCKSTTSLSSPYLECDTVTNQSGWASNNSAEFIELTSGQTYYYYVKARDGLTNSTPWIGVASSIQGTIILPPSIPELLIVLQSDWNTDVTTIGQSGTVPVGVIDTTNSNERIAEVSVDFSTTPVWTGITGGTTETKSFFHSISPISTITNGASSTYTLYVKKGEGDKVWICPGAASLNQVTLHCSGGFFLSEGQTVNGATALVEGLYWKISGLTGTGGMSVITGLKDTLSRLELGVGSDHTITFGTNYGMLVGSTDAMEISFPDFDLTGLTISDIVLTDNVGVNRTLAASSGVNTWGVEIDNVLDTITFSVPTSGTGGYSPASQIVIKIGLNAGGTNQIVNPSSIGSFREMITLNNTAPGEMGEVNIPIVDNDRVDVTGYVTAYMHFDIDTATGEIPGVDSVIDCNYNVCLIHQNGDPGLNYTVDLGELTSAVVNKSNGTSVAHTSGGNGIINSIYFDISTNAPAGAVVSVKSTNGGLQGPGTNKIPSIGVSVGADGITRSDGQDIPANSGVYGYNLPIASSLILGSIIPNSLCDSDIEFCGPDLTPKTVFTTNNLPVDTARVRMDLAAAANYTNNPGLYTDTLTFIATATF